MFKLSRRRDHSLQPLTKETADPNAATAAASAFKRGNQTTSSSLSSAAAAAALRAQPSTPTNVAEVSSKRSQRRTASVSSPVGRDRGKSKLHRSPSVSSMSERTFRRSPSPGRTPLGKQDVPPMPRIPASKIVSIPLQTQNFHTASQNSKSQRQGSWFGAPTTQNAYQERGAEALSKLTPDLPESRSGSVSSSINFSYPRGRMTSEHDLIYDPNSRRMVPKDAPTPMIHQTEGIDSKYTEKLKGTKSAKQFYIPQKSSDEMRQLMPDGIEPEFISTTTGQCHAAVASSAKEDATLVSNFYTPAIASTTEAPSQERELEVEEPQDWQGQNVSQNEATEFDVEPDLAPGLANWDNSKVEIPFSYAGSSSETSVRSAHFASSTDQLVIKHEPPPRSLSPRKSALKSALSNRGNQPSHPNENMEHFMLGASHSYREDSAPSQKRGARVSWNDNSTVVVAEPGMLEEAESAAAHGLQSNTLEGPKASRTSSLQQDELMSPRPALPLFGSVRDKKGKEPEERQLVRPREHSSSPQPLPPSSSLTASSTSQNETPSQLEPAKASYYGRGQTPRNVANISKYREPLPAIIASTESLGQVSEDVYSSEDEQFEDVSTGAEQSTIQKSSKDVSLDLSPLSNIPPGETSKVYSETVDGSLVIPRPDAASLAMHRDASPTIEPSSLPGSFPDDEDVSRVHTDDTIGSITPSSAQILAYKTANQGEDESDKDSIYSDAYEDLSDVGDSGFMSLDAALVSSPLVVAGGNNPKINTNSGGKLFNNTSETPIQSPDDWEKAKAYWKSLSSEERRQLEMEALEEADDEVTPERVSAKRTTTLPGISGQLSNSEQRSQRYHEPLLQTDLPPPKKSRQQSLPSQSAGLDRASFKPAEGSRKSTKKSSTTEMKRAEESMRRTDYPMTDIQRWQGSLQQPTATTPRTGMAMGRRLQKLAHPKRSMSYEQKYIDDEIRGPATRPQLSYNPIGSPEYSLRRPKERTTHSPTTEPMVNTVIKPTLRRRGSDSSESSFVRSRSISGSRRGFRASMRSSSFDSKPSSSGNAGRNRLTLRSLSPTTSHPRHHSAAPAAPSRSLAENARHQPFHRHSVAPQINQSLSRKDEVSTYGDHISDSSDDDLNTTPLTNGSIAGDEYEPVHSRLKQSILNMYARNNPPDQTSGAGAGFNSGLPQHEASSQRGDQIHIEENAHIPLDQLSSASARRPGLISTLRRKSHANVRDVDADNAMLQHNTEDATSTRNSVMPNHAIGWPLQNRKGETNEASMTSPLGDKGRRSAASGSVIKEELTSEPRHQHELQFHEGSFDATHANTFPSQGPKRKKFNNLRKMFKINN